MLECLRTIGLMPMTDQNVYGINFQVIDHLNRKKKQLQFAGVIMGRRGIQKRSNFIFPKPLIGILIGLIMGVIMFWIFHIQEKSEWTERDNLVEISGILSEYEYHDRSWNKSKQSVSRYEIGIAGQGVYILSNAVIDEFNWRYFEQIAKPGDSVILYVDKSAKETAFKNGEIYEIWNNGVCYFSYEEYIEAYKSFQKESSSAKWLLSIGMCCIGIIVSIDIWRKEKKQ